MKSMEFVAALDQGTTSTRFILFNREGVPVASRQKEHRQIYPKPGWVEQDPLEIWERTQEVILETLRETGISPASICSLGITNQRETTVLWDPVTGKPYCNALVWQDTRTASRVEELLKKEGIDRFRSKTGLPLATYFSNLKIEWILNTHPELRDLAKKGRVMFGTLDTWLIWLLTGGTEGGVQITDATNASRTQLMDLHSLDWDGEILDLLNIPREILPAITASFSREPYGYTLERGPFGGKVAINGALGDQQAALFGQACFKEGESKNTYGTGCFLLQNTGGEPVLSRQGLITTVAYLPWDKKAVYALEGSIAVAGSLVQWLRDNLGLISSSSHIESLAREVEDNGGVYIVPAFSGLFAPHWRSDARGVITGLTAYAGKAHLARAVLEATAFQTQEIVQAMERDSGIRIPFLKVDGGMVVNELLMQFQADILGIPVLRPRITETTALGAAYAAGLGAGFWKPEDITQQWREEKKWVPLMGEEERNHRLSLWNKAVKRSLDWS